MILPPHARSLATLLATAALWLSPAWAHADCAIPAPEVLWSYPAAGQSDVPTNATLWLRLSRVGNLTVTLNGAAQPFAAVDALSPEEPGRILQIEPTALAPDTDYVLRVSYDDAARDAGSREDGALPEAGTTEDAGAPGTVLELAFKTSGAPAPVNPAASTQLGGATVDSIDVDQRVDRHSCRALIEAQGCFDTGLRKSLTLTVQAEQALAFLVLGPEQDDTQLWPARCGPPLLQMRAEITDILGIFGIFGVSPQCYEVRAVQPGGLLTEAVSFCTDANEPSASDAGSPPLDAGVDASTADATTAANEPGAAPDGSVSDASVTPAKRRDDDGCRLGDQATGERAWSTGMLLALVVLARRRAHRRRAAAHRSP